MAEDDAPAPKVRDDVWKERVRGGARARSEALKELMKRHSLEFDQLHAAARQKAGLPPVGVNFDLTAEEIQMIMDARAAQSDNTGGGTK